MNKKRSFFYTLKPTYSYTYSSVYYIYLTLLVAYLECVKGVWEMEVPSGAHGNGAKPPKEPQKLKLFLLMNA